MFSGFTQHTWSAVLHIVLWSFQEWVNRRTDRRISKIFLPGFRIQSEFLTYFLILQLQQIADSSIFSARILDFAYN